MKRGKRRTGQLGTVSHGTMRPEDLIPAFLDVCDDLRLSKADRKTVQEISKRVEAGTVETVGGSAGTVDYYDGEATEDLSSLFDLLGNYAPPFCYFGAIEGDGSDYGFWTDLESLEHAVDEGEVLKESSNGMKTTYEIAGGFWTEADWEREHPALKYTYRMVVSDHGNVTLYHRNGKEIWGVV